MEAIDKVYAYLVFITMTIIGLVSGNVAVYIEHKINYLVHPSILLVIGIAFIVICCLMINKTIKHIVYNKAWFIPLEVWLFSISQPSPLRSYAKKFYKACVEKGFRKSVNRRFEFVKVYYVGSLLTVSLDEAIGNSDPYHDFRFQGKVL